MTLRLIRKRPLAPELEAAWTAFVGAAAMEAGRLAAAQLLHLEAGPVTKEEVAKEFLRGAEAELVRLAAIEAEG